MQSVRLSDLDCIAQIVWSHHIINAKVIKFLTLNYVIMLSLNNWNKFLPIGLEYGIQYPDYPDWHTESPSN